MIQQSQESVSSDKKRHPEQSIKELENQTLNEMSTNANTNSVYKQNNYSVSNDLKRRKIQDSDSQSEQSLQFNSNHKNREIEEEDDEQQIKWNQLEHHGYNFPHAYKILPKNVKMIVKKTNVSIEVPNEVEELAAWWADVELTDFGQQPKVKQNFWKKFGPKIDKKYEIIDIDEIDFQKLRDYKEQVKQQEKDNKKNRSVEQRKIDDEQKQKLQGPFQYCIIDGELQKVANATIEPPGIFRGRGEHPNAGKIKSRIVPEYVTLNLGLDAVIPSCPIPGHSWKSIVQNQQATWLGRFEDEKNDYSNSCKYLFLAAESSLKGISDKQKYEKARKLKNIIGKIRNKYMEDMQSNNLEQNQLGVAVYLIDRLALRVGNEKGEDEADTVGCCSLRVEHISLEQPNKVTFDFLGKDSMRYHNTVEVDPIVFNLLQKFTKHCTVSGSEKQKDQKEDLFDRINASKLNEYLKKHMPELSAKVFRTYNASITLQTRLHEVGMSNNIQECSKLENKINFYNQCNRDVAILCNHKKAESKNLKEQLQKLELFISQKKKEQDELNKWKLKIKKCLQVKKEIPENPNNFPNTVEQCQKNLEKLEVTIKGKAIELQNKKENAEVALGTSKINYMDPRITISWCKRTETPIEKIFPKTLRSKFAWAMNNDPVWNF